MLILGETAHINIYTSTFIGYLLSFIYIINFQSPFVEAMSEFESMLAMLYLYVHNKNVGSNLPRALCPTVLIGSELSLQLELS